MTKYILLIVSVTCLLMPFAAFADDHDEVTIRVMQMDEETPDSLINRIELPVFEDAGHIDSGMAAHEQNDFADEMDSRGFEFEVEIQGMQNEISNQGHGK